ncbi:MAG: hypothetical protein JWN04_1857 [Myxococcaceae bacterium]|nr:hypothetical protein [Myxococcaceae bacterium]
MGIEPGQSLLAFIRIEYGWQAAKLKWRLALEGSAERLGSYMPRAIHSKHCPSLSAVRLTHR